ncbi:MAG TPA: DUF934 domain-containing protein [Cellvibrio sp.]|nr:DUF934 domain-containing protein [Cellvibrio sp.]
MKQLICLQDGVPCIVQDDPWVLIESEQALSAAEPQAKLMLPLALWLARQPQRVLEGLGSSEDSVWLSAEDDPESLHPWLAVLPLIALHFDSFRDGRPYTQAYILRSRLGWAGELRAFGDVLRDQLSHMRHCGMDSFAIRADKSPEDAIKGLSGLSVLYGRSAIEPKPLFRRR